MSLSLIKSWVFDLDNTLYDPEEDIFSQIDKKMTSFISKRFDINTNDAFNIQKEYFLEYGTTLAGLMNDCLLYTSPSPRDRTRARMPSSA